MRRIGRYRPFKKTPLKKVFKAIEEGGVYRFVYKDDILPKEWISIRVQHAGLSEVMDKVLENTGLTYHKLTDNLVVIIRDDGADVVKGLQAVKIGGKVTSEKREPLYMGDGRGHFIRSRGALPSMRVSKGYVRVADVNGDGVPDLFVGGRAIPGLYPLTPASYLLINDGHGHFTDRTADLAPALGKIGMVTDAVWADMNGDGLQDLVVAGEWMPISVFVRTPHGLVDRTKDYFDRSYSGWWNKLWAGDLNGDGKPDLVAGIWD